MPQKSYKQLLKMNLAMPISTSAIRSIVKPGACFKTVMMEAQGIKKYKNQSVVLMFIIDKLQHFYK